MTASFGRKRPRLFGQMGDIAAGGQRLDHIGIRVARDQFHRVAADRTGRSENGHMPGLVRRAGFLGGGYHHARAFPRNAWNSAKDRRCDNKPVHAVKQTAMSGDETAAVLHIVVTA